MNFIETFKETRKSEDGAAMMVAIMFAMIMLGIAGMVAIASTTGMTKQVQSQNQVSILSTADTAINNAVALANNPKPGEGIANHIGIGNAVYGSIPSSETSFGDGFHKWLWYAEPVSDNVVGSGYNVIAIAYNVSPDEDDSRTLTVRLQPIEVTDAVYLNDGSIGYAPVATGNFVFGLFGANGVTLENGALVRSFDSSIKQLPVAADDTRVGVVSSNKQITLNSETPGDTKRVIAFQAGVDGNIEGRCVTEANCSDRVIPYSFGLNTLELSETVKENCPLPSGSYPNWVSSQRGNRVDNNTQGKCFNNVIFDADTEVQTGHNKNAPAMMYITGNITVLPSVKVNQSELRGGPLALRIYSSEGTLAQFNGGTAANRTRFSALVGGYTLNCVDVTTAEKSLVITGGLACNTVNFKNGTTFWWDQATWKALEADESPSIGSIFTPIRQK